MARPALAVCAALFVVACGRADAPAKGEKSAERAVEAAAAPPAGPSFDCDKAESSAEKLVCSDAQLTGLDRETARLYALARARVEPVRVNELEAYQRGWIKGRDDCWKAADERACIIDSYASRIHELRRGYANTRSADGRGVSSGPMVVECEGFDASISAIFVKSDPEVANLMWLDRMVTLVQQESASGTRYVGTSFDGQYVFWSKGDEATFERPRGRTLNCKVGQIG